MMELFWKTNQRMSVNVCNILPVPTLTRLQVNEPDFCNQVFFLPGNDSGYQQSQSY